MKPTVPAISSNMAPVTSVPSLVTVQFPLDRPKPLQIRLTAPTPVRPRAQTLYELHQNQLGNTQRGEDCGASCMGHSFVLTGQIYMWGLFVLSKHSSAFSLCKSLWQFLVQYVKECFFLNGRSLGSNVGASKTVSGFFTICGCKWTSAALIYINMKASGDGERHLDNSGSL